MSTLDYEVVDVFTDRPFTGNPLAVVFGADGLDQSQMQALAREFHLSETVFVLTPTTAEADYRARIFTPATELPFAGHPSVGVAVTLRRRGLLPDTDVVTQECGVGLLPIHLHAGGRATLTGGTPTVGPGLAPDELLAAVGLSADDYVGPAPRLCGCGVDFPYLSVRAEAVAKAKVRPEAVASACLAHVCVFAWDGAGRAAHSRVFVPGLGVPEDPATGSAALGLGVWLVASGLLPADGQSSYVVSQGSELRRPSTLECTVTAAGGVALGATVSGAVVPIAKGQIAVPPFIG
jgi:trans-2,3-dihydro-3-hydroxyanthranilate isomerase